MEIKESISILQSPKKIWDFWMPVTTDVKWRDGITKAEWTSQPPYGIGSTGTHYLKDFGAIPWTIIKWDDGRHVEWVFGECKMKGSIGSYHVEPDNGGSRVTIHSKYKLPFLMRILMVFMGGKMKEVVKADLQKLKAIMERQDNQSS
jgi:uncharacterized membrane protein